MKTFEREGCCSWQLTISKSMEEQRSKIGERPTRHWRRRKKGEAEGGLESADRFKSALSSTKYLHILKGGFVSLFTKWVADEMRMERNVQWKRILTSLISFHIQLYKCKKTLHKAIPLCTDRLPTAEWYFDNVQWSSEMRILPFLHRVWSLLHYSPLSFPHLCKQQSRILLPSRCLQITLKTVSRGSNVYGGSSVGHVLQSDGKWVYEDWYK